MVFWSVAGAIYGFLYLSAARHLYQAWRPMREPVCTRPDCYHDQQCRGWRKRRLFRALRPAREIENYQHDQRCYRRIRADKTRVAIDSDAEAVSWAAFAALLCPVLAFAWLIRFGAPELAHEKEARLRRLDEQIAERERQLAVE
jgi:hypothetical protein